MNSVRNLSVSQFIFLSLFLSLFAHFSLCFWFIFLLLSSFISFQLVNCCFQGCWGGGGGVARCGPLVKLWVQRSREYSVEQSYRWLELGILGVTMSDARHDRVSAKTFLPGVNALRLAEIASFICHFRLSVAANKAAQQILSQIHFACGCGIK